MMAVTELRADWKKEKGVALWHMPSIHHSGGAEGIKKKMVGWGVGENLRRITGGLL